MRTPSTRAGAVEAAVSVARVVGLEVHEPRVLRDVTNMIVHLSPAPVVARVPMTFTRVRPRAWIDRELALTSFLADARAPIAGPVRSLDPGPYEQDGFLITLWEYVDHDDVRRLDGGHAGAGLREVHEQLARYPGLGLDHFARLDELAELVPMLALSPEDRDLFRRGMTAAAAAVERLDPVLQPIHGDAHLGNVLRSSTGPLWSDFENACLGPRELDVACNEIRARTRARTPDDDDFLRGYGDVDIDLISALIPVHAVFLAAWTFQLAERLPEIRAHAVEGLGWVRAGFAL